MDVFILGEKNIIALEESLSLTPSPAAAETGNICF